MNNYPLKDLCREWIAAWNNKNLEAILALYDEDIEHTSPKIARYLQMENNTIKTKVQLKEYFQWALESNMSLNFNLIHLFEGHSSCILVYWRNAVHQVAEYLEFNRSGKIIRSKAHELAEG